MTKQKVGDLEMVRLSDYFTPGKFRTVSGETITRRGGISEVRVVFHIHYEFAKRLTFDYSTLLIIYGYGIMNDKLIEINGHPYVSYMGEGNLKRVSINDCGERFVMVFELRNEPDKLVAVSPDDVAELLNNCRHPQTFS